AGVRSESLYGRIQTDYTMTLMDLDTLENVPLIEVGDDRDAFSILPGWSPDGQSVIVWGQTRNEAEFVIAHTDGSDPQRIPGFFTALWLADGTVLSAAPEEGQENQRMPPITLYRYDPATGERIPLNLTFENPFVTDLMAIEGTLYEQGIMYDDSFTEYGRAALLPDGTRAYIHWTEQVRQFQADVCSSWEIRQRPRQDTGPGEVIYSVDEVTYLTDLTALPDGSLLFLQWKLEGCQFVGAMTAQLLRLVPGQESSVVVEQVNTGLAFNPNRIGVMGYVRERHYAVSPDGRYVFWTGGGISTGTASIHVTDLESGETAILLVAVPPSPNDGGFESVFWLPRPIS
ncbi:MAG: hypothetical protein JW910_19800, partial [Anaerolineae bacterium]|nr:hypothetical protein [Anaerolineae bacterium]